MTPIRGKDVDLDGDGKITEAELAAVDNHNKLETQTRIAVASFVVMTVLAGLLVSGLIPDERIKALGPLVSTLFIAKAGIIGAFFGMTGYMSRK
tara:strand:- start:47 stop:328 length:282 start_codon:yes stop_codon:yes gene_type:complete